MEIVQVKGELADSRAALTSAHAQLQMMQLQITELETDRVGTLN